MTRATVSVSRGQTDSGHGLVWSVNLSTIGVILSVLIGTITLAGLLYAGLRTAIHPLITEEVTKGIAAHVETYDAPAHLRLLTEIGAAKAERQQQVAEIKAELKGDLAYIRSRVDQIVDTQARAAVRGR